MAFYGYASLIVGNGHLMVMTIDGELLLVRADRKGYELIARRRIFDDENTEIWSHPALVKGRLFLRSESMIRCLLLE